MGRPTCTVACIKDLVVKTFGIMPQPLHDLPFLKVTSSARTDETHQYARGFEISLPFAIIIHAAYFLAVRIAHISVGRPSWFPTRPPNLMHMQHHDDAPQLWAHNDRKPFEI